MHKYTLHLSNMDNLGFVGDDTDEESVEDRSDSSNVSECECRLTSLEFLDEISLNPYRLVNS